jgi:hypothetical protein
MPSKLLGKKFVGEKEKEALQEKYKEHRQSIWFGEYSRKVKKKKNKGDVDNFVSLEKEKFLKPLRILGEDKEPARSEIENAISVAERAAARPAPTEEQARIVILRRAKGKKSIKNEAPDDKTIILERHEPQSKNSKETKRTLTLIVFIGIVAVIVATVLGVLLGFLLAKV